MLGHSSRSVSDVAGMLGVEPGQHHEQRRRIYAAVIEAERNLAQRRHLAAAHLVRDFSGFGVDKRIECGGLKGGEPPQDALGDAGIAPQHLQRRDDAVAAERGRVPGNAGIRVGTLRRVGRQHREVGHRAAYHLVEDMIRAGDRGHAAARGLALLERRTQALAKRNSDALFGVRLAIDGHVYRAGFVGLQVRRRRLRGARRAGPAPGRTESPCAAVCRRGPR